MTTTAPGTTGSAGPVLRADGVGRVFGRGDTAVHALRDVSLTAYAGELLVVRGPSGSGKTTLLNILGGLDRPTTGSVHLGPGTGSVSVDRELSAMSESAVLEVRRREIGYVFQSFGLVPVLSAAENVEVPLRLQRVDTVERAERVAHALALVGLEEHAAQRPYELSGGQQQRVGIARALVAEPSILVADEPTGQLDSGTAATVMDLIRDVVHTRGVAAVVSTHDPLLVQRADRVLELHDGLVVSAV
ncbi:ABC transporter ATP-binding protein [Cellulosimicrobium terreum]|nr:ABC transporter ATP-binding protein [Cellulosimicrobium terreum]